MTWGVEEDMPQDVPRNVPGLPTSPDQQFGWILGPLRGNLQGGGGATPSQTRKVTKQDCEFIREIIKTEKQKGYVFAAEWALDNGAIGPKYTNNTSGYNNKFPTSQGGIDLDWYSTLVAKGGPNPPMFGINVVLGHALYIAGKSFWDEATRRIPQLREGDGSYKFEWPYRDPGERTAAKAYANGLTYRMLFDKKWFDTYCKGK